MPHHVKRDSSVYLADRCVSVWVGLRSITANWHLRLTSSLSTSTLSTLPPSTVYCLTLLLLCQPAPPTNMYCLTLPWRQSARDRQQCPPYSEPAVAPMVGRCEQFWAGTPLPNVRHTSSQCERHYFLMWETPVPNLLKVIPSSVELWWWKEQMQICSCMTFTVVEARSRYVQFPVPASIFANSWTK